MPQVAQAGSSGAVLESHCLVQTLSDFAVVHLSLLFPRPPNLSPARPQLLQLLLLSLLVSPLSPCPGLTPPFWKHSSSPLAFLLLPSSEQRPPGFSHLHSDFLPTPAESQVMSRCLTLAFKAPTSLFSHTFLHFSLCSPVLSSQKLSSRPKIYWNY